MLSIIYYFIIFEKPMYLIIINNWDNNYFQLLILSYLYKNISQYKVYDVCFRGKLKEAVECLEKAIPLSKSEKELLHIFSLRDSAQAQLGIVERLGLTPQL